MTDKICPLISTVIFLEAPNSSSYFAESGAPKTMLVNCYKDKCAFWVYDADGLGACGMVC